MNYFEQFKDFELFNNENLGQIRTLQDEKDDTWFLINDIADILEHSNATKLSQITDKNDLKALQLKASNDKLKAIFWNKPNDFSNKVFTNEYGLYQIIMRSDMPKAREFQKWITHEVIPAIREHGGYIYGQEKLSEIDKEMITAKIEGLEKQVALLTKERVGLRHDVALLKKEKKGLIHDRTVLKKDKRKLNEYLNESDTNYEASLQRNSELSNEIYHLKHPEIREQIMENIRTENQAYEESKFKVDSNGFRIYENQDTDIDLD